MSASPPRHEPAAPFRIVTVADPGAAEAACAAGADALVIEVAGAPGLVVVLRARWPHLKIYAALDGPEDPNLGAAMAERPDGVLVRDARSGRDIAALGARLAVFEAESGLPDGSIPILAAIGHALGLLEARSFVGASPRLAGLGFDATALAGDVHDGGAVALVRRHGCSVGSTPASSFRGSPLANPGMTSEEADRHITRDRALAHSLIGLAAAATALPTFTMLDAGQIVVDPAP